MRFVRNQEVPCRLRRGTGGRDRDNLEDGDRTRLRRELDARLERKLEEICLSSVHSSLVFGALAPDGVPESDKTASARCRSPANTS